MNKYRNEVKLLCDSVGIIIAVGIIWLIMGFIFIEIIGFRERNIVPKLFTGGGLILLVTYIIHWKVMAKGISIISHRVIPLIALVLVSFVLFIVNEVDKDAGYPLVIFGGSILVLLRYFWDQTLSFLNRYAGRIFIASSLFYMIVATSYFLFLWPFGDYRDLEDELGTVLNALLVPPSLLLVGILIFNHFVRDPVK